MACPYREERGSCGTRWSLVRAGAVAAGGVAAFLGTNALMNHLAAEKGSVNPDGPVTTTETEEESRRTMELYHQVSRRAAELFAEPLPDRRSDRVKRRPDAPRIESVVFAAPLEYRLK